MLGLSSTVDKLSVAHEKLVAQYELEREARLTLSKENAALQTELADVMQTLSQTQASRRSSHPPPSAAAESVEHLHEALAEAHNATADAQKEVTQLSAQLAELRAQHAAELANHRETEDEVDELISELDEARAARRSLLLRVSADNAAMSELQAEAMEAKDALARERAARGSDVGDVRARVARLEADLQRLQAEYDALASRSAPESDETRAARAQLAQSQADTAALLVRLAELDEETARVRSAHQRYVTEAQVLKTMHDEASAAASTYQTELAQALAEAMTLTSELSSAQARIEFLRAELESVKSSKASSERSPSPSHAASVSALQLALDDALAERKAAMASAAAFQTELDAVRASESRFANQVSDLAVQLEEAKETSAKLKADRRAILRAKANLEEELTAALEEIERLRARRGLATARRSPHRGGLPQGAEDDLDAMTAQVASMRASQEEFIQEAKALSAKLRAEKAKVRALEEELAGRESASLLLSQKLRDAEDEAAGYSRVIARYEAETDSLASQVKTLSADKTHLASRVASLEETNSDLVSKVDLSSTSVLQLQSQVQAEAARSTALSDQILELTHERDTALRQLRAEAAARAQAQDAVGALEDDLEARAALFDQLHAHHEELLASLQAEGLGADPVRLEELRNNSANISAQLADMEASLDESHMSATAAEDRDRQERVIRLQMRTIELEQEVLRTQMEAEERLARYETRVQESTRALEALRAASSTTSVSSGADADADGPIHPTQLAIYEREIEVLKSERVVLLAQAQADAAKQSEYESRIRALLALSAQDSTGHQPDEASIDQSFETLAASSNSTSATTTTTTTTARNTTTLKSLSDAQIDSMSDERLRAELRAMREDNAELRLRVEALLASSRVTIASLKERLMDVTQANDDLEASLTASLAGEPVGTSPRRIRHAPRSPGLNASYTSVATTDEELRDEILELREDNVELREQIKLIHAAMDMRQAFLVMQIESLTAENAKLSSVLQESGVEEDDPVMAMASLKAENDHLRARTAVLQRAVDVHNVEAEYAEAESSNALLSSRRDELLLSSERQQKLLEDQLETLHTTNKSLRTRVRTLEADSETQISQLEDLVRDLQAERDQLRARIDGEGEGEGDGTSSSTLLEQVQALRKSNSALQSRLDTLSSAPQDTSAHTSARTSAHTSAHMSGIMGSTSTETLDAPTYAELVEQRDELELQLIALRQRYVYVVNLNKASQGTDATAATATSSTPGHGSAHGSANTSGHGSANTAAGHGSANTSANADIDMRSQVLLNKMQRAQAARRAAARRHAKALDALNQSSTGSGSGSGSGSAPQAPVKVRQFVVDEVQVSAAALDSAQEEEAAVADQVAAAYTTSAVNLTQSEKGLAAAQEQVREERMRGDAAEASKKVMAEKVAYEKERADSATEQVRVLGLPPGSSEAFRDQFELRERAEAESAAHFESAANAQERCIQLQTELTSTEVELGKAVDTRNAALSDAHVQMQDLLESKASLHSELSEASRREDALRAQLDPALSSSGSASAHNELLTVENQRLNYQLRKEIEEREALEDQVKDMKTTIASRIQGLEAHVMGSQGSPADAKLSEPELRSTLATVRAHNDRLLAERNTLEEKVEAQAKVMAASSSFVHNENASIVEQARQLQDQRSLLRDNLTQTQDAHAALESNDPTLLRSALRSMVTERTQLVLQTDATFDLLRRTLFVFKESSVCIRSLKANNQKLKGKVERRRHKRFVRAAAH